MSMMEKRSGKKHIGIRILGLTTTVVIAILGIYYTLYHLSSGFWMYNSGLILAGFVSLISIGFVVFVLEWDSLVKSS